MHAILCRVGHRDIDAVLVLRDRIGLEGSYAVTLYVLHLGLEHLSLLLLQLGLAIGWLRPLTVEHPELESPLIPTCQKYLVRFKGWPILQVLFVFDVLLLPLSPRPWRPGRAHFIGFPRLGITFFLLPNMGIVVVYLV